MIDYDEEDTDKMRKHQDIADRRMAVALPILVVSGVLLLMTIAVVVALIVRASETLKID